MSGLKVDLQTQNVEHQTNAASRAGNQSRQQRFILDEYFQPCLIARGYHLIIKSTTCSVMSCGKHAWAGMDTIYHNLDIS